MFFSRSNSKSLDSYKKFNDKLNESKTEEEVFQNLHSYMSQIFKRTQITIFFKKSLGKGESQWNSYPHQKCPVCNMDPRLCPVTTKDKECFVNNIQTDLTCAFQFPYYSSGGYICLKSSGKNEINSVIQLYHKGKNYFDEEALKDIRKYISLIDPIIDRINNINTLNLEAYTDKLTQVNNRTYFEHNMSRFLDNSNISGKPLCSIMLDIDNFKRVNDTYGHPAGDCILIEFAKAINQCVRTSDVVCRYGGEEFIVILPDSNIEYAKKIGERIRKTVFTTTMPILENVQLPSITCSIGISIYPDFSNNKDSLIKTADLALYYAKKTGKNRVVVYNPNDNTMNSI
jgi:diguanylate cyclase (GGDEF)-like protein